MKSWLILDDASVTLLIERTSKQMDQNGMERGW